MKRIVRAALFVGEVALSMLVLPMAMTVIAVYRIHAWAHDKNPEHEWREAWFFLRT